MATYSIGGTFANFCKVTRPVCGYSSTVYKQHLYDHEGEKQTLLYLLNKKIPGLKFTGTYDEDSGSSLHNLVMEYEGDMYTFTLNVDMILTFERVPRADSIEGYHIKFVLDLSNPYGTTLKEEIERQMTITEYHILCKNTTPVCSLMSNILLMKGEDPKDIYTKLKKCEQNSYLHKNSTVSVSFERKHRLWKSLNELTSIDVYDIDGIVEYGTGMTVHLSTNFNSELHESEYSFDFTHKSILKIARKDHRSQYDVIIDLSREVQGATIMEMFIRKYRMLNQNDGESRFIDE